MKKLFSFLVILMMAMTAWAEDISVAKAYTWADIKAYVNSADRASKVCVLQNDIDFEGANIESLSNFDKTSSERNNNFTIDGNGHTIKNGVLNDNKAIIVKAENATFINLSFKNITTKSTASSHSNRGILVDYAGSNCIFENLSFDGCSVTLEGAETNEGAIVCGHDIAESSQPVHFTNITIKNCSVTGAYDYLGTIVALSTRSCVISNCHVSSTTVKGRIYVGGLVARGEYITVENCSFDGEVYAEGVISTGALAGGIVGSLRGGSITNCENSGEIAANEDYVAGIVGEIDNYSITGCSTTITGCKNTGWIHHKNLTGTDDGIAGIVAYGNGEVHVSKCVNDGSIDGGDAYAGGIAGYVSIHYGSYIKYCINTGFVNGDEQVGGIVGCLGSGATVQYCIGASTRIEGGSYTELLIGQTDSEARSMNNYWISDASNLEVGAFTVDDLMSGRLAWHINNKLGETIWTQNLETDAYPTFGTEGVHYARTMANEWGTIVLPYDIDYSQSNGDYKLYKLNDASVSSDAGTLTFTEYENGTIAAGTPMAVKKFSGDGIDIAPASSPSFSTSITEQNTENAGLPSGWTMNGTYTNLTDKTGIYYIANNEFWYAGDAISIAPYRAWFTGPALAKGAALRIVESEGFGTSTIGEITADSEVNFSDTPIYNIQGQHQQDGQMGLQIRGGRVVLMR